MRKEKKVIPSWLLIIIITKVILRVPSFNQYHVIVTVSAYPNRKLKQVAHLHMLDMLTDVTACV